jgi:hypothetical protein
MCAAVSAILILSSRFLAMPYIHILAAKGRLIVGAFPVFQMPDFKDYKSKVKQVLTGI